jgi:hypothetical protein
MVSAGLIAAAVLWVARDAVAASDLVIQHTPVTWAVKGQPLTLKATVQGGAGGVAGVTLYYALFRDAAPYRVNMSPSGLGMYVGTIDAGLLSGVESVSYYIEAQDKDGSIEETPWYDVKFKAPETAVAPRGAGGATPAVASGGKEEGSSAMTIGLIAGGAAAVGVAAYLLSDSGSDDDGGGSGGGGGGDVDPVAAAGNYAGSSTLCLSVNNEPPTCQTTAVQFLVDAEGRVFTESLVAGQQLVGTLSGGSFSLVADVSDPAAGLTGTIVFSGTVVNNDRIVGSITGNADVNGVPGVYSGTFSANKQ